MPVMADIEILAEDAAEVAAGKEYRPRAPAADQDAFLAEVRTDRADDRLIADAAKPGLAVAALSCAPARAERTGGRQIPQPPNGLAGLIGHGWPV